MKRERAAEVNKSDRGSLFLSERRAPFSLHSGSALLGKGGLCPVPFYPHVVKQSGVCVCVCVSICVLRLFEC